MINKELHNEIIERYKSAKALIYNSDYKKAIEEINLLHKMSIEINFIQGINFYYELLCYLAYYTYDNYLGVTISQYLISIYKKENNNKKLMLYYTLIGTLLTRLNDFENSNYYLNKALKLNHEETTSTNQNILFTYISIALNKIELKEYNSALDYLNKVLKYFKKNEIPKKTSQLVYIYTYKILTLIYLNQIDAAWDLYKTIFKKLKDFNLLEKLAINIVLIRLKIAKRTDLNDSELLELLNTSLKKAIKLNETKNIISIYKSFKEYYIQNKNYELAYKYADLLISIREKASRKQTNILTKKHKELPAKEGVSTKDNTNFEIYYKTEMDIVANYQRNFHKVNLKSKKLKVETYFKSIKPLSGDYIGTFNLCNNENLYLVILADVVGKDIKSSYISFMLDGILKSIIINTDSFKLKKIIKDINTILSDTLNNHGYVSLWAGLINLDKNEMESINAGHLPTYTISEQKRITNLTKGCTILGMFKELDNLESEIVPFNKGNSIIAYSNGLTEATDIKGQKYDIKFTQLISNYTENQKGNFISLLKDEFQKHLEKTQIQDDTSCLYIEYLKE